MEQARDRTFYQNCLNLVTSLVTRPCEAWPSLTGTPTVRAFIHDISNLDYSNGASYSFSQKFEIEKARPDGGVEEEGLFYLKFNVVTFLRKFI